MGMKPGSLKTKKRLVYGFIIVCLCMLALCFRVGWIQIVNGSEYADMATKQQTRDVEIEAKRGSILDRNGQELAASAVCYSVWARPALINSGKTEQDKLENVEKCVLTLSEALGMETQEVYALVTQDKTLVKIAKYLDKDTADKLKEAGLTGIEFTEEVKRHYPLGNFASQVLGSVTDDNNGLSGLELKYNRYLSGVSGRWIKNADRNGRSLSYGVEKYYGAEDGTSIVLTIDEVIQHYAEQAIVKVLEETNSDRVMCLMMDPKTGDILAMATTPGYDPNNPRVPSNINDVESFSSMTTDEQLDYLNRMWRNPIVSDLYEPGSTSKLLTTSIALEEGLTYMDEQFRCTGYYDVYGTTLKCWRYTNPHGYENLIQAVGNSCNPVFIQLAQRIGIERFYDYMELYGMSGRTGIDFPGEAYPILQDINKAGPVGLATMSYGQGIAVTMVQQLTAICSLGNGGKLMKPRLVKALTDSDGNVTEEFETQTVRQVISEKTASEMCLIMEYVVSQGGAGAAKIPGYKVGGKTGTAQKPSATGGYSDDTYSSFIGMAPMDDPQVAILLVVDNPKGIKYGSTTAAPGAKEVLENTLRYLGVQPEYTQEEKDEQLSGMTTVPDVTGNALSDAAGIVLGSELEYIISPALAEADEEDDYTVVDQFPKAGETVEKGQSVYLYTE